MIPFIITYVRHAVPGCGGGDATGLERLSYDGRCLMGDGCLSAWSRDFQKQRQRPVQNIEIFGLIL